MVRGLAHILRSFGHAPGGGGEPPPAATTLTVANDGNGSSVTATITGTGGITYRLYYVAQGGAVWTAGQSRSGSGTVQQTGLTDDTVYTFTVIGESDSLYSLPYGRVTVHCKNTAAAEDPSGIAAAPLAKLRKTLAGSATWQTLVGAGSADLALPHIFYFGVNTPGQWAATTAVVIKACVRVEAAGMRDLIFEVTTAGTTGDTEPTWPTSPGGTVGDGSVTWTARDAYGDPLMGAVRASRPFALVGVNRFTFDEAAVYQFAGEGELFLYMEADVPVTYAATLDDAGIWWANRQGAILSEIEALAGQPGSDYLNIRGFRLILFERTEPDDIAVEGDRFRSLYAVRWQGA